MNLLISACLLGVCCRYDGLSKEIENWQELNRCFTLVPVCPEIFGGLKTPRVPAERIGSRVLTKNGKDVTAEYQKGAQTVLQIAQQTGCQYALLKERSPSCGKALIYDGTFSGTITKGSGICAELLEEAGIHVFGENQIEELLALARKTVEAL